MSPGKSDSLPAFRMSMALFQLLKGKAWPRLRPGNTRLNYKKQPPRWKTPFLWDFAARLSNNSFFSLHILQNLLIDVTSFGHR